MKRRETDAEMAGPDLRIAAGASLPVRPIRIGGRSAPLGARDPVIRAVAVDAGVPPG
jgi:hypothetical protein